MYITKKEATQIRTILSGLTLRMMEQIEMLSYGMDRSRLNEEVLVNLIKKFDKAGIQKEPY